MKKYTFLITGASPYDGEIIIVAKTVKTAKRMAYEAINKYNEESGYSNISLACDEPDRVPFDPPCIVHFESGES